MGMGFAPTWLRQVSPPPPASQNHFNHWLRLCLPMCVCVGGWLCTTSRPHTSSYVVRTWRHVVMTTRLIHSSVAPCIPRGATPTARAHAWWDGLTAGCSISHMLKSLSWPTGVVRVHAVI